MNKLSPEERKAQKGAKRETARLAKQALKRKQAMVSFEP